MTEPNWRSFAPLDSLPRDDIREFEIDGVPVAVVRTSDDRIFAVDAQCSHGKASLAEGYLDGIEIECPKHNGRFNVTTGEAVASPARTPLQTFPCRIADGCIEIQR